VQLGWLLTTTELTIWWWCHEIMGSTACARCEMLVLCQLKSIRSGVSNLVNHWADSFKLSWLFVATELTIWCRWSWNRQLDAYVPGQTEHLGQMPSMPKRFACAELASWLVPLSYHWSWPSSQYCVNLVNCHRSIGDSNQQSVSHAKSTLFFFKLFKKFSNGSRA